MSGTTRPRWQRWGVPLALLALVAAACGGDDDTGTDETESSEDVTESSDNNDTESETTTSEPADEPAEEDVLDIAFIQTGPFEYYQMGADGVEAAAEPLGVTIDVFNSELDPATEIANVEDAIQKGVDGIILFSVSRSSEEAALQKANEAGIPVAVLYGYDEALEDQAVVFVQTDVHLIGEMAGTWMGENIAAGEVAMVQGALGRGDVEGYTEGWSAAIEGAGLEIAATLPADWDRAKAVTVMEDILSAHPDLAGVWVNNEDMALGAVQAIESAGKADQVTVVSMNGSPTGLEALEDGSLAATVGSSPSEEAQMALVRLVDFIRGGQEPDVKLCSPPVLLVTLDNLAEASPWVPTEASTSAALERECFVP